MNSEHERYRLVRPLATGGMAELFLGVVHGAEGFEKPVAIKRMLPHLARDPVLAKMFLAEARLSTHLQHQNIASVYDVGSGPDGLFLVMELVNGWDLGVLLRHAFRRDQRFPPHLVAFIGAQVLAGLLHAYRRMHGGRPVLTAHRDISPSNILLSREGEVKVTDFGIARLEGLSMGTQPGTFKGKLPYASPETLRGEPATAASDQFALGIVLYELLANRHPFGDGSEPMAFALGISQQEPAPLTDVPAPLAAVVMRALAKAPQQRFPRPEDMAEALARYLAQAGEPASSEALATFLASLEMPPTLLELGEVAETPGMELTVRRHQLPTRPMEPASFQLQNEEEWEAQPGGRALSMSGRLVMPTAHAQPLCVRCNAPLPSAHAPCDRCARELAPGLSSLAEAIDVAPPARPRPAAPPPAAAAQPAPTPPPTPLRSVMDIPEDEELELAERAPRPESDYAPPAPKRRRWGLAVVALVGALLVVAGGVMALPQLRALLDSLPIGARAQTPLLSIQSEPSGATVRVDGVVLGETPLVLDNVYPRQDIPVELSLKGYKPWKGTFAGGEPASVDIQLRR